MKHLYTFVALTSIALYAADIKPTATDAHTQRIEFPSGGSLRLVDSFGELNIEGWDQPAVEITTTKSAFTGGGREKAMLDTVKVETKTDGKTVIVTTLRPHRDIIHPLRGIDDIDLEYTIKVPFSAHLEIEHEHGEVNISGVTGDINATSRFGPILIRLPANGHYAIDAHSRIGTVYSDFSGSPHRRLLFGESFASPETSTPQKLNLKAGMGDIMILTAHGR